MNENRKTLESSGPLRRRGLTALLGLALAGACLTPPPASVSSPDAELTEVLEELADVRGGGFEREPGAGFDVAAREGSLTRELRKLAFLYPRHVPTLVANAALSYENNDPVRAQKYLDQALALEPEHVPATLLRVRIACEGGNLPYARRKLNELLELRPDDPGLHEALAGVFYLMGEFEQASRELDLVERLRIGDEGRWRTEYHRGLIAEAQEQYLEARSFYTRSRRFNPAFDKAIHRGRWLDGLSSAE